MEMMKMILGNEAIYEFYYWADEKTRQEFWQDWIRLTACRGKDEN